MKKKKFSTWEKEMKKADKELEKEITIQSGIIYPLCMYVLWKDYGWRQQRINNRMGECKKVWDECGEHSVNKSVLQMLEEETGIELQLEGMKSYHEYSFLDTGAWKGRRLTPEIYTETRKAQKKWLGMTMIAAMALALHRSDGFGAERIGRFIAALDARRQQLGEDPEAYRTMIKEETPEVYDLATLMKYYE